jgi:ferritin-like metal-binding protein YciE
MSIENFDDLFVHLARDTYNAEKQLTKALPKLARSAANDELRQCFEQHLEETEQQVERLEQIFEMMGQNPKGMKCEAAEGLVQEAQEIMGEIDDEQVRDAGLIAAAQAFEHYEIARYGTLVAWAQKMGQREVVRLLQQTLREEHNANNLLNQLAEQTINEEAMEAGEDSEEDEERSGNGHRRQEMSGRSQGKSGGNGGRSQSGRQQSGGRSGSGRGQEQSRSRQQASRGR